jgi:aspartate/methionine/tyrosine aminotransferase
MAVSPSVAERIAGLKPEGAYKVLAKAKSLETQGRDIVHLEIGEPDFPTPSHISLSGIQAIAEGETRYNPSPGLPALRSSIAREAGAFRSMEIVPDQVVVAPGAKPILFLTMLALVEPGDEVVCPDPGFPSYGTAVEMAGGKPVFVPLDREKGFDLDAAALDRSVSPRTKVIILNSPGNPTGRILSAGSLEAVADIARENDCWVLSDEIYSRLTYEPAPVTVAVLPGMAERTIIVDGFSKTYAMTGWRLGFGIMPEFLAQIVGLLLTHSVGCTATFTQLAGADAINGPQNAVETMRKRFMDRRDAMVEGLNRIPGVRCQSPQGAFYAFPNVEGVGRDPEWLAAYLLEEAGVALLPGTDFGTNGNGHLRLCYANSLAAIQTALERICRAVERLI